MSSLIIGEEAFWSQLASFTTLYRPGEPIVLSGRFIHRDATIFRKEMFSHSIESDDWVAGFLEKRDLKKVLDLGCAIGINSGWIVSKDVSVTGIDIEQDFLDEYLRMHRIEGGNEENLSLKCWDITKIDSYGEGFDHVLALDVLPYVPPRDLRGVMEKIRNCMIEGGYLIGTLFFRESGHGPDVEELTSKVGGSTYPEGVPFARDLLKYSGFELLTYFHKEEGAAMFLAEKKLLHR